MFRDLKGRGSFKQNFNFGKVLLLVMLFALFGMVANMDEVEADTWELIQSQSYWNGVGSNSTSDGGSVILGVSNYREQEAQPFLRWRNYNSGGWYQNKFNEVYTKFPTDGSKLKFRFKYSGSKNGWSEILMDKSSPYTVRTILDEVPNRDLDFLLTRIEVYQEIPNKAPTTPPSINVPSPLRSGTASTISWGTSTDADGDSITYRLERSINGGSWKEVYSGSSRSYTETSLSSWNTVAYRVRAYDGTDYSGYKESPTRTVTHNTAPTLTITSPSKNSYFSKVITL